MFEGIELMSLQATIYLPHQHPHPPPLLGLELLHELRGDDTSTRIDGDLHGGDLLVDVLHELQAGVRWGWEGGGGGGDRQRGLHRTMRQ